MGPHSELLATLRATLRREGLRGLVIHLNGLTQYRFTSLYRFDKDQLQNLCFYDRESPAQHSTPSIPVMASYCVFVRDSAQPFHTPDSLQDECLTGHPKQQAVRSYCGVPLVGEDGRMLGTICHFDLVPRVRGVHDLELLEAVATLLNEWFAETFSKAASAALGTTAPLSR
jgi:GAF domain-containing protein